MVAFGLGTREGDKGGRGGLGLLPCPIPSPAPGPRRDRVVGIRDFAQENFP